MSDNSDYDGENPYDEFAPIERSEKPNGPEASEEGKSSIWDDDAALESLAMEKQLHPEETEEDMAKRFLREAVPRVTQGLIQLAMNASNENTKLNAQKFVLDMVLRDGDVAAKAGWEDFVGDAVSQAEIHANTGSSER